MNRGISFQGFIPMYRDPSEVSEIISQVLFGESFDILASEGGWLHITLDFDRTGGWVTRNSVQLKGSMVEPAHEPDNILLFVYAPSVTVLDHKCDRRIVLPAGSLWPESDGKSFDLHGRSFEITSRAGLCREGHGDLKKIGEGLLSIPYLRGGRCGFGFDASGLVQTLSRMMGLALPRECQQQAELGTAINFMHEIRKGDLAFFDNQDGQINHVGLVLDDGLILHVNDQVRIDKIDQQGIFCPEKDSYTHKLRVIKRIGHG